MPFSFVAYPHGLPRKQSPGISLQFSGPSTSHCPPVLELFWKSLFKIKSLHLQTNVFITYVPPFLLFSASPFPISTNTAKTVAGHTPGKPKPLPGRSSPSLPWIWQLLRPLNTSVSLALWPLQNLLHPLSLWNVPEHQVSPTERPRSHHKIKPDSREWKASSSIISPLRPPRLSLPLLPGLACCLQKGSFLQSPCILIQASLSPTVSINWDLP